MKAKYSANITIAMPMLSRHLNTAIAIITHINMIKSISIEQAIPVELTLTTPNATV